MISVASAIIGGIIAGVYMPFTAPIVYASSRCSKRIFLLFFSLYTISLGYEYELTNIYQSDLMPLLAIVIPTLLLLDSGLRDDLRFSVPHLFFSLILLLGLIFPEIYFIGLMMILIYYFKDDFSTRGFLAVFVGVTILLLGFYILKDFLNVIGGSSTQTAFISSIAIFSVLIFWRKVSTSDF